MELFLRVFFLFFCLRETEQINAVYLFILEINHKAFVDVLASIRTYNILFSRLTVQLTERSQVKF